MPKLYFHDTGLACWLLGIREPRQPRTHPLRGALFETWVVSEVVKHRTHRGHGGGLSFYRDRNGAELDLVIEEPDALTLVEAKSSATPSSNLLAGARRVGPHLTGLRPRRDVAVVYGGEEVRPRAEGRLAPWRLVCSIAPPRVDPVVQVFADGQPVAGAGVLALFPDGTGEAGRTDARGRATRDPHPRHLPLTVFVAGEGFAAHLEPAWIPDERALHVGLTARPGGGSAIAEQVTPGSRIEVVVSGKGTTIDLVEGLDAAAGARPARSGREDPRRLVLRVVAVVGGAALLDYGPYEDRGEPAL